MNDLSISEEELLGQDIRTLEATIGKLQEELLMKRALQKMLKKKTETN